MTRSVRTLMVLALSGLWLVPMGGPAAAGGGCHSQKLTDKATTEVVTVGACFTPVVARVDVGDTVTWSGNEMAHTVTGASAVLFNEDLAPDGTVTSTFDEAGVYPYSCLLHPGMIGAVVVGERGEDAVSSAPAPAPPADPPTSSSATPVVVTAALVIAAGGALAARRASGRRRAPAPVAAP